MSLSYEILLLVGSLVAIALVPILVLRYRSFLVRRRLKDLYTNLWNAEARDQYLNLFGSGRGDKTQNSTTASIDAAIAEEFFRVHSFRSYSWPLLLSSVVAALSVITIALWADSNLRGAQDGRISTAVVMSLSGAYVWALYEILSRSGTQDLAPSDLSELTLRFLAAIPVGYAFSLLAIDGKEGLFAFIAAAFPLRDIRLFLRQRAMKKLDLQSPANESRVREGHLGKVLDGLSDATLARLEELGIVTYMDLAYTNPVRLMARTGYSLRHILAWIDQALLAVYAPSLKLKMADASIQCALDACEFYEIHVWDSEAKAARDWVHDPAVQALATALQIAPALLIEILREVYVDPHVRFLDTIWY